MTIPVILLELSTGQEKKKRNKKQKIIQKVNKAEIWFLYTLLLLMPTEEEVQENPFHIFFKLCFCTKNNKKVIYGANLKKIEPGGRAAVLVNCVSPQCQLFI